MPSANAAIRRMKIAAISLATGLLVHSFTPFSVLGQVVDLGIVGGVNMANIDADNFDETNGITRIGGGLSLAIRLSPGFAIQPELIFSQKGTEAPFSPGVTMDFKLDYVQLPVLFKLSLPFGANFGPSLFFGPSAGLNISCKASLSSGSAQLSDDCDEADLNVESLDYGFVAGAGLDVGGLGVFLRYEHSLSDFTKAEDTEAKNRVYFLGARLSLFKF